MNSASAARRDCGLVAVLLVAIAATHLRPLVAIVHSYDDGVTSARPHPTARAAGRHQHLARDQRPALRPSPDCLALPAERAGELAAPVPVIAETGWLLLTAAGPTFKPGSWP